MAEKEKRKALTEGLQAIAEILDSAAKALHAQISPIGTREEWEAHEHITRASSYLSAAVWALLS